MLTTGSRMSPGRSERNCETASRASVTASVMFFSSSNSMVVLDVPRPVTVDTAIEWISGDELVEVTPHNVRIRKMILNADERRKARIKAGIAAEEAEEEDNE